MSFSSSQMEVASALMFELGAKSGEGAPRRHVQPQDLPIICTDGNPPFFDDGKGSRSSIHWLALRLICLIDMGFCIEDLSKSSYIDNRTRSPSAFAVPGLLSTTVLSYLLVHMNMTGITDKPATE